MAFTVLEQAITQETRSAVAELKYETAAWMKYRESLARMLSNEDWDAVVTAYEIIEVTPGRVLAEVLSPQRQSRAERLSDAAERMHRLGEQGFRPQKH